MIYDSKKIQEEAKKDFIEAWKNTKGEYPKPNEKFKEKLLKPTKPEPHPIQNTIAKIRSNFLRLGFREIENPLFIEEQDVYKQYGPEAPAILDRCYYLAGIPRPDVGLSDAKANKIKTVVQKWDNKMKEKLRGVLREYKLGRIEGDDLVETIEQRLGITTEESTKILSFFDELKNLKAEPTQTTLRSHMTAGWFPTLEALQDKSEHPLKLFSIGLRFRREQRVDSTHLRAHYGASCAVLDKDMEIEAGKALTKEVLKPLGFKDFEYEKKQATSTYYANDSEYEVYAKSAGQRVEIADIGMYSPIALANYNIKYPVFNAGFGIERILMIKEGFSDVREAFFPQFYQAVELTDEEIADAISIAKKPSTEEGRKLSEEIQKTAAKHADDSSPCSFEAFSGDFLGKKITVNIVEKEEGTKLLGPAALNEVFVYDSGIYGIPPQGFKQKTKEITENGIKTGVTYLQALSDYFAAGIEDAVREGKPYSHQFKMAKTAPELNLNIPEHALKFIQSKKKPLMLKGPLFTQVEMDLD
jgi:O-phosphoseryl-tRNA synthetase